MNEDRSETEKPKTVGTTLEHERLSTFGITEKDTIVSDDEIKPISIKDIISEDGAHELATSPAMRPYLEFMKAEIQGLDLTPHLKAISALPLEQRYVWRVASALRWGFADFDDETVNVDKQTLEADDLVKLEELLRLRPIQFCMFLRALVGPEEMERVMNSAIKAAL